MNDVLREAQNPRIQIITGLSGAGRSTCLKAFEDLGYEAVDNLPLGLIEQLALAVADKPLAIGIDSRSRDFKANSLLEAISLLKSKLFRPTALLFLDCESAVLASRFTETRRKHPLAADRPVADGIALERALTNRLRDVADDVIETSSLSVTDFRAHILERFALSPDQSLTISIVSFAYKRGLPRTADLVFDARFLRNPHYVESLRPLSGCDPKIRAFVKQDEAYPKFIENIQNLIGQLLPRFIQEGKSYLTLAIGCTGGRHRSVAVAEHLTQWLRDLGHKANLRHRELGLETPPPGLDEKREAGS